MIHIRKRGDEMVFIGSIVEKKDENDFDRILRHELETTGTKATVVRINEKSMNNIKNIHFETIIMNRNLNEEQKKDLKEILKNTKYFIVNSDIINMEQIQNMNLTVITYGFGSKCTVTASSMQEDNIIFCLQRGIENTNNTKIEPQELKIKIMPKVRHHYLQMAISIVNLLYSKS